MTGKFEKNEYGEIYTYPCVEEEERRIMGVEWRPEVAGGGRRGCRLPRNVTEKKRKKGRERESMGGK